MSSVHVTKKVDVKRGVACEGRGLWERDEEGRREEKQTGERRVAVE
jgi:hypothetical protein